MNIELRQNDSPSPALDLTGIAPASADAFAPEVTGETPAWWSRCLPQCLTAHWVTVSLLIMEITVVFTQVTGGTNPAGTSPE